MQKSSSIDVDLVFVALHQANLQWSQKSSKKYPMNRGLYFYDQFTRVSHLGGIARHKRHPEELNQALHYVRVALAAEDSEPAKSETPTTIFNPTPSPVKQQVVKQTNESLLRTIQRKLNAPILPDLLFRELDSMIQRFDDKSKTSTTSSTTTPKIPSSIPPKSGQTTFVENEEEEEETDVLPIQEAEDEDELIAAQLRAPKVSLPGALIIALHSSWTDLIEDTEYTYKVWRTKAGEDFWQRRVEHKRAEQVAADKQRVLDATKRNNRRRFGPRTSVTSIGNISHQQQSFTNSQMRSNRSASHVSFVSTNNMSQLENLRLLKSIPQGSSESLSESVKSGIHVEFKLSIQADELNQEQQSQIHSINEQKGIIFDISKPTTDVHEDVIALMQTKCKRLLAEMKHKISTTGMEDNPKMCKIWFYGDSQHIRNRTTIFTLNEFTKKHRSRFIYTLLRREIPERYNIEITLPENKHKCLLETIDGTIQIYYPSGRLAVLRLNSPNSYTLFFDDTDVVEHQFLGLVTSTGNIFIMQPTLHARFTSDSQRDRAYLCNGKTGIIEKQIQWHFNNSSSEKMSYDGDDDILPPLLQTTVQLQLNSFMQLEYHSPTNIRFAFACHREEYKFQLGTTLPSTTPVTPHDLTTPHLPKKTPTDQKKTSKSKSSNNSNEPQIVNEKQQIQIERLLDGQVNLRELPMIKELTSLRKRIRHLFNNWLKEYRIALVRSNLFHFQE